MIHMGQTGAHMSCSGHVSSGVPYLEMGGGSSWGDMTGGIPFGSTLRIWSLQRGWRRGVWCSLVLGCTPSTSWETSWRVRELHWVQRSTPSLGLMVSWRMQRRQQLAQENYKKHHNQKATTRMHQTEDWVLMRFPSDETGKACKLSHRWHGQIVLLTSKSQTWQT